MPTAIDVILNAISDYSNGDITQAQLIRKIGRDNLKELVVTDDSDDDASVVASFIRQGNHHYSSY